MKFIGDDHYCDRYHHCGEQESSDAEFAMKGNTFCRDEQHLHQEQKHPDSLKNRVHVHDGRGEFRRSQARQVIGSRETGEGRNKQGNDHSAKEIAVIAPSGQLAGRARQGLGNGCHGFQKIAGNTLGMVSRLRADIQPRAWYEV